MSTVVEDATEKRVECPECHTTNEVAPDAKDPKCTKCNHDLSEALVAVVEQDPGPRRQAVERAAGKPLDPEEDADTIIDATDWFLAEDEDEEGERAIKTYEIDVGIKKPKLVRWVIGSLDRERISEIRKEAREQVARRQGKRRGGGDPFDDSAEMIANLRIAVEGTVNPDFSDERMRKVNGKQYADPADAMRAKFKAKSGIIDQIAGYVILLSGFSSDDIQEVDAVKG